jgi:hypothetical protein
MKPRDISKEIFGLAIRLLGLYFLWVGLSNLNVPALMNVQMLKGDEISDILTAVLPAAFNLAVAWWLLGGKLLIRRAYPEAPRMIERFDSAPERSVSTPKPARSQELTDMECADKKLEAFLTKPKQDHSA